MNRLELSIRLFGRKWLPSSHFTDYMLTGLVIQSVLLLDYMLTGLVIHYMFGIDMCSAYTGQILKEVMVFNATFNNIQINKDFLHW
jgi:hypothetical protein